MQERGSAAKKVLTLLSGRIFPDHFMGLRQNLGNTQRRRRSPLFALHYPTEQFLDVSWSRYHVVSGTKTD